MIDTNVSGGHSRPASLIEGNPLVRKLSNFVEMSARDRHLINGISASEQRFEADTDLVTEGMAPRSVFLLLQGMAVRYRSLPDGGRQIITFLIEGDLCDSHVFLLKTMDHSIGSITQYKWRRFPATVL